jgi:hypothetical protein
MDITRLWFEWLEGVHGPHNLIITDTGTAVINNGETWEILKYAGGVEEMEEWLKAEIDERRSEAHKLVMMVEAFNAWNEKQRPHFVLMVNCNGGWHVDNMENRPHRQTHYVGNTPSQVIDWFENYE